MPTQSLKDLKVLIVEDDQFLRDLFAMKLKKEGAAVIEVEDGEAALRKIEEENLNLVLLDIVLPKLDGFEVLKAVKGDSKSDSAKIPIIMLTNLGQQDDVKKGLDLGADAYIIKAHFTPSEVVTKIKEVLKS